MNNKTWGLIILGLLIASLVVLKDPWGLWPMREGLDIAGGVRVVMQLDPPRGVTTTRETQKQVIDVLERRVNTLGVSEPVIQPKGQDQVIVELAENEKEKNKALDKREAVQILQKAAKLEFVYLDNVKSEKNPLGRYEYSGASFTDRETGKPLSEEEVRRQILYVDKDNDGKLDNVILTGKNLLPGRAQANFNPAGQGTYVTLALDPEGRDLFADFTRQHVKDLMAIVYDGKVTSAPVINEEIPSGEVQITLGSSPLQEAVQMADLLNSGALPVPLKVVQIQEVEASLGRDSVAATKRAGFIGFGAICLFMVLYYLLPGTIACVALLFYAILSLAVFNLIPVVLTLPGIAGFILSIGMAVDANILINERMKEELRAGKTLHAAIDAGFARAFPSIRDSNLSTLITCAVLWMYGTGSIRGFAMVLGIGVILSFFTAVTASRALLHLVISDRMAMHPTWFGVRRSWLNREGGWKLEVIRNRWYWFAGSSLFIIPGLIFFFMGGLKPGIDFTGGSMTQYAFTEPVQSQGIRDAFRNAGIRNASVQLSRRPGGGTDAFIRTRELSREQRVAALNAVKAKYPKVEEQAFDSVGSTISRELVWNAFITVFMASLLIMLFLAWQFQSSGFVSGLKYGFAAFLTLIHDAAAILGLFTITGYFLNWEINSLFVTAVLTVLGFSVHDTIVIFDRIRENWRNRTKEMTFAEVINNAVNQTLSRSVNTGLSVILVLVVLFFFGGSVLKLFVAALLFGILCGTYSSIFVSSPLLWMLDRRGIAEKAPVTPVIPARKVTAATGPARKTPAAVNGSTTRTENPEERVAGVETVGRPSAGRVQVRAKRKKRF